MSFSDEPKPKSRKKNLLGNPVSREHGLVESNPELPMPESTSSTESPSRLTPLSPTSSETSAKTPKKRTMTKSLVVPQPLAASPSMPDPCSTPSTKQPAGPVGDIHDGDDLPPYLVRFDPRVAKKIQRYGIENEDFNPRIATMIADLESDPKSYPKKRDKLAEARAYSLKRPLKYRGTTWRTLFSRR